MRIHDDDDALLDEIIEQSNRLAGRGIGLSSSPISKESRGVRSEAMSLPHVSPRARRAESRKAESASLTFYEFFSGGGMARIGLGDRWRCLFANDFDQKKAAAYRANFGVEQLHVCDVADLTPSELPGSADLAWASFPCQDLSLAGAGAGLSGARSGAFWAFWKLIGGLVRDERAPRAVVLENVVGLLSSRQGRDFGSLCGALSETYRFGAVVIDAVDFVPQSRPRLFVICVRRDVKVDGATAMLHRDPKIHPAPLASAVLQLPRQLQAEWIWWRLGIPEQGGSPALSDVLEDDPQGVEWHSASQTARLLSMMSAGNLAKVRAAQKIGRRMAGGIYKRTRFDETGAKVQRAEVRFDGVAGCLRTPGGGSSRQTILIVEGDRIRSRLLSPRETARLMGLPDSYVLPVRYNDAYHLTGDGVVAPVVRHLSAELLEPLLGGESGRARRVA